MFLNKKYILDHKKMTHAHESTGGILLGQVDDERRLVYLSCLTKSLCLMF
jgi:hypothetical protein